MPHLRLVTGQALALSSLFAVVPLVGGCGGSTTSPKGTAEHDAGEDSYVVVPHRDAGHDVGSPKHDAGVADVTKKPPVDAGTDASPQADAGTDAGPLVVPIAVPLYACQSMSYTSLVTIGGTQTFQMTLDTGSSTMGVASNNCTNCNVLPYYTPGPTATDENMTSSERFGSGTGSEVIQDNVNMGASPAAPLGSSPSPARTICSRAAGVRLLPETAGAHPLRTRNRPTVRRQRLLRSARRRDGHPQHLRDPALQHRRTLWLGGYDPAAIANGDTPQYTPEVGSYLGSVCYAVNLESIKVGGQNISSLHPAGHGQHRRHRDIAVLRVDSRLPQVAAAIEGTAGFKQVFGVGGPNGCSDAGSKDASSRSNATIHNASANDAALAEAGGADAGQDSGCTPPATWFNRTDCNSYSFQMACANLTQTAAELDSLLPPSRWSSGRTRPSPSRPRRPSRTSSR